MMLPSNSVRSTTPKRIARATSGSGRDGASAYRSSRFWRPISIKIFEAGVGENRDARAFLFEQRVGRDGGTVGDGVRRRGVARKHLAQAADDGVGRVGRRREHFVHANFTADDRDEVGERAAGIDSDQYRAAAPFFHVFTFLLF